MRSVTSWVWMIMGVYLALVGVGGQVVAVQLLGAKALLALPLIIAMVVGIIDGIVDEYKNPTFTRRT